MTAEMFEMKFGICLVVLVEKITHFTISLQCYPHLYGPIYVPQKILLVFNYIKPKPLATDVRQQKMLLDSNLSKKGPFTQVPTCIYIPTKI